MEAAGLQHRAISLAMVENQHPFGTTQTASVFDDCPSTGGWQDLATRFSDNLQAEVLQKVPSSEGELQGHPNSNNARIGRTRTKCSMESKKLRTLHHWPTPNASRRGERHQQVHLM